MATVNFINRPKGQNRGGLFAVLAYSMKAEKTAYEGRNLVSGVNCSPQSVYHEFINTKLLHQKCDGRMYYHFVQAFHKDEDITPQTAHEMALKLADFYKGYEVLVCTHTDREHIHSHFIVNSVNLETGKKLHQSAQAIQEIRMVSDNLCMEYELSICKPKEHKTKAMSAGEYHSAKRGNSWKFKLMNTIDECMSYATTKEMFLELMESEGYKVKWTDTRKNITYTTPQGSKCRDDRLHELKYLKERMELEFTIRRKIVFDRAEETQQDGYSDQRADTDSRKAMPLDRGNSQYNALQPRCNLGKYTEITEPVAKNTTADEPVKITDKQPTYQDRDRENEQDFITDTAELVTGWEEERETLFNPKTEIAEGGMVMGLAITADDIGRIGSDILQLGKSVERLSESAPVIDSTTQMVVHERKRKGNRKKDDHESQEFKMSM